MRRLLTIICPLLAAAAYSASAQVPVERPASFPAHVGIVFEQPRAYPGIRLLQVDYAADGTPTGKMVSTWYGDIPMLNLRLTGKVLSFETRNLNTPDVPTRHWTARLTDEGVVLTGGIWQTEVKQTGRMATVAEERALAFRAAPAPPALAALPDDGLARTPPMGWSSWNKFADRIDDRTVRAMADAMVSSGLRDAGYVYVNIDDGWQGERDAAGELRPNAKFPDMKALADYVHARGLKLGLYSSPGPKTCAGYTGSYGHVQQDARAFAHWGVDYLKYDLCSGEWFYSDADGVKRAYQQMAVALRATGRPIVYSLCEYGRFDVADWGKSVGGHLWRTTGDISDDYKTMADIGFERNPTFTSGGPGGWNDPDMLEIGNGGMTDDEYRTHMTLWAMQAAPLLMGHDLRRTTPAAAALLKNLEVIAVDQDAMGAQGTRIWRSGTQEIWRKPLANSAYALALFNRSAAATTITVPDSVSAHGVATRLRDLWRHADVSPGTRNFLVPPNGAILLVARPN